MVKAGFNVIPNFLCQIDIGKAYYFRWLLSPFHGC
jgi:hypothetical protein